MESITASGAAHSFDLSHQRGYGSGPNRTTALWLSLVLFLPVLSTSEAYADTFYAAPLQSIALSSDLSKKPAGETRYWYGQYTAAGYPHVLLETPGEAYAECGVSQTYGAGCKTVTVYARTPSPQDVAGTVVVEENGGFRSTHFRIPANTPPAQNGDEYLRARRMYFQFLERQGVAGTALFRHELAAMDVALARGSKSDPNALSTGVNLSGLLGRPVRESSSQLEQTLDILSGGRAVAENLQLDRALFPTEPAAETVPVATITGIQTKAINWKPLLTDPQPPLDPLAAMVPENQYGAFFPSFPMLEAIMDDAHQSLGEMLRGFETRSETAESRERYQNQLCLPLSEITRIIGPHLISEIAVTGSDPFFRTGTDVALLMRSQNPAMLYAAVRARQDLCRTNRPEVTVSDSTVDGYAVHTVRAPARDVSSSVTLIDNTVIVTNSTVQIERIAKVAKGAAPSIGQLDEYRFFRTRYRLGDADEAALIILPDAAIRGWVGPTARIGASRRTRAAAFLAELQIAHATEILEATSSERPLPDSAAPPGLGALTLSRSGVRSSIYGTTGFLTPIAELPITHVSEAEKNAYERFRTTYESYWKRYFDPIALRIKRSGRNLEVDLTVMPLIVDTDYRFLREITSQGVLDELSGDPHSDSLLEVTVAIDSSSPIFTRQTAPVGMFLQGLANPFGWIGKSATLFLDGGSFWDELARSAEPEREIEKMFTRIPIGLFFEVRDSLKLTAFLTALRSLSEQSAPGLATWETLNYRGVSYVRIGEGPGQVGRGIRGPERPPVWSLYYAATSEAFILTLDQSVLTRAIDRLQARSGAGVVPGRNFGKGGQLQATISRKIVETAIAFTDVRYRTVLRDRCLSNLPILNEWKRRYPERDPIEVHRRLLNSNLVCHAGGTYQWNESARTMESTLFGHPGNLRSEKREIPFLADAKMVSFGLGFEEDGLRAKMRLER